MRQLLVILLFLCFISVHAQRTNKIEIGTIDSLYSTILGEPRQIWVHVPDSDPNSLYSKVKYPVVYLLDGDAHFYSVMGMIQQLSEVNGNTLYPKMIVVGIPNTNRTRDLTPTHSDFDPFGSGVTDSSSGGGEKFTAFMEKELIPYIDSMYPTAPHRILIGHSLGGLMVINTLVHHPALFDSYLSIDPSMWWHDHKLLKETEIALSKKNFKGKTLFLGIANTMPPGLDTATVKKDTTKFNAHIRSILQLATFLKNNPASGLRWSYKYYKDDDHGSVPLIAEYDALRFMFSQYRMSFIQDLFDPASTMNGDSAVTVHYKMISKQMGYTVLPDEAFVNGLGYNFVQAKMFDKAYSFFNMNIQNYPMSFNAYDSMGDFYDAKGDKTKAIQFYTKALSFRDYPDTRRKLQELQKRK